MIRKKVLTAVFLFLSFNFFCWSDEIDFPEGFGKINDAFVGNSQQTVVIIQDAHRNYECQTNTIEILNSIETKQNIPLIAVEGAQGEFLTDVFSALPDRQINQDIATYFLKEGRITSPEYFSMVSESGKNTELYGVEDPSLYMENLSAFKNAYGVTQELGLSLSQVKDAVRQLKDKIYSKRLNELDRVLEDYQDGKISFKNYFRRLLEIVDSKKVDFQSFQKISLQKEVFELEEKIQFSKLEEERSNLLNAVSQDLPPKTLSDLLVQSLHFKMNRVSSLRYHELLWKLAEDRRLSEKDYPNFRLYLEYVRKISQISEPVLFQELSEWVKNYQETLIVGDDERRLQEVSRKLALIEGFFGFRISNKDFDEYLSHREDFNWEKIVTPLQELAQSKELDLFFPSEFKRLDETLPVLVSFYQVALKRDGVMVENTLKRMQEKNYSLAVLISGGFHTRGIGKLLKEKGISYYVVTPKVTLRNVETPYFSLLLDEKNPIEQWVQPGLVSGTQAPLPTSKNPIAQKDRQTILFRLYDILQVGTKLLDVPVDPKTGTIPREVRHSILNEERKLDQQLGIQGADFRADFQNATRPREGVLQIPIYKRNERGEVVQSYLLMGRGTSGRDAVQAARKAQGFPEGVADLLNSPQGDIALSVVLQPLESTELLRQNRDQALSGQPDLGEAKLGALMDQLTFGERSIDRVQGISGQTLDQEATQNLLNNLYSAARSPLDFMVVADLMDSAIREGKITDPENVRRFQNKSAISRLQARAATEQNILANFPFKEGDLKDEPKIYAIDISTVYQFTTDDNNEVKAHLRSPSAARMIKSLQDKGYKVVITSMTAGVGIPQMERLLDDIGLTFDRNFLIDVNTIAQRYATAEGQEANTRLFNRNKKIEKEVNMDEKVSQKILETLIAEIKERTQAREGQEIALIGTDERIIRKKLQGVVAVVIKHEAGNITSFDEAITLVRYARSFYESGGKVEPPAEIMAALVQQLGKIGWDEARIRDELRKAGTPANKLEGEQTGVMTVDPHPTEAADYLQGIDGMEDVVVGQAA